MPEQCSKTSPKEIKCVREVYIKEMYFKETKSRVEWGSAPTLREICSALFISKLGAFIRFPP